VQPPPASILLIKPGSLGDVVHALPVAAALHEAWPDSKLSWVIDPRWQPIVQGNPAVAECVPFPRQDFRGAAGFVRAAKWMAAQRGRHPELTIDLQCLLRSALIARAARSRHTIGLSDAREGADAFYDETARVAPGRHAIDRYLSVLPLLGIPVPERPRFHLVSRQAASPALPERFVLLHPYARGAGKSLDGASIRALCERIAPTPVVLVGIGGAPSGLPENVIDLTNRTALPELVGMIAQAASVVSVDSGPMHLAAAMDSRLLSIHTWSDPRLVGPYSRKAWIWQGGKLRPQDLRAPLLPERAVAAKDLEVIAAWAQTPA